VYAFICHVLADYYASCFSIPPLLAIHIIPELPFNYFHFFILYFAAFRHSPMIVLLSGSSSFHSHFGWPLIIFDFLRHHFASFHFRCAFDAAEYRHAAIAATPE